MALALCKGLMSPHILSAHETTNSAKRLSIALAVGHPMMFKYFSSFRPFTLRIFLFMSIF